MNEIRKQNVLNHYQCNVFGDKKSNVIKPTSKAIKTFKFKINLTTIIEKILE